ncbi:MAG: hypothetical protein HY929_04340 [Euryarchaeota archaeon]|nr:hypothetical protein [Euryarchaeota archaeon]
MIGGERNFFKIWSDGYSNITKMWLDSYFKLYSPWIDAMKNMSDKATEITRGTASPEAYKEFYNLWTKTYEETIGKFIGTPLLAPTKETFEKLLKGADDSVGRYKLWIAALEDLSKKTTEMLEGETDPREYKELYDRWVETYEDIFDDLLGPAAIESTRELFGHWTGVLRIYSDSLINIMRMWMDSYFKLYSPWIDAMKNMSDKATEITRGTASPEAYKEFYNLWMKTYEETFGKFLGVPMFESVKGAFDPFWEISETYATTLMKFYKMGMDFYFKLYKLWI